MKRIFAALLVLAMTLVCVVASAEAAQDLVIAFYGEGTAVNFDPEKTWDYGDWEMLNECYDTLVTTDFDGSTISDAMAESWEVSEDGLTYTFHLKDGVKFHSGKPCTSADVKWTFERWTTDPECEYAYYLDAVESIDTPDDLTVVLNLSQPDNNLLINLTTPVASIMNGETVEQALADGKVYGVEVVDGTGPFKFVEYVVGDHVKLEKNPDYAWGSSIYENQGAAKLDTVTFRFVPEAGTRIMELQAGNVHILGNGGTFASELAGLEAQGFTIAEYFPPYPVFLMFQTERVPDIAVRKAMNMAINREEIITIVMQGHAVEMKGGLPSDYEWYWNGADNYYPYDIEGAKAVLTEAGYEMADDGYFYKDGQRITVEISYCESNEDAVMSQILQAQMKNIGVDLTINTSTADFWERIGGDNDFDVLIMELYINSAEDMLQEYMYSKNMPSPNRSRWSSEECDQLLIAARTSTDQDYRRECYNRIQEIALENALWIPVYSRNGWTVVSPAVEGFRAHPTIVEGCPKLVDVSIAG